MPEPRPAAASVPPLTAADRAAIDDLLASYVLSLDVDDIDAAVNLFVEEGEFHLGGRALTGRDRLRRMFTDAPRGMHLAGRSLIAPSPAGATVRQQLVFFPADRSARRLVIYDDDLVRAGDRWLFRRRQCRFMNEHGTLDSRP